ncbi:hypothetical protein DR864_12135 [Runella rosea]|jgi:hypothetical protein|uniref:Uncharacterized protein n=2 Tax=Runella TaxID=105 RepID=A0A344TIH7_9BACT|nr:MULTISPECIES: hypothetical protein [Runella]AXE18448.1 hypothetical protein DR864_12135 [Runella rosea]MCP1381672.1 hypothetical protein [Runella salmonicolor]NBB18434.1 hypothetical protein [Runella sp. CRIBMP]
MNLTKILIATFLFLLGSFGHWYIMYWQFKSPKWISSIYPYLLAIACTWLWIKASEYGVKGFNGSMWSNRFLFFVTGVFVGSFLYPIHFGQTFTLKVAIQLLLALAIIVVSIL